MRGIKEVGDETTPTLTAMGDALKDIAGVDLLDEHTGQLRDTYDVLEDLAEVWETLTINERQYLGELLAGKRQIAVLESLMTNWQEVDKAQQNATDSLGSAKRENEIYLDSINGRLAQLSSAFQQLAINTINSDMVKFLVDVATALVKIIDKVGLLNIAIVGIFAYMNKASKNKFTEIVLTNAVKILAKLKVIKADQEKIAALNNKITGSIKTTKASQDEVTASVKGTKVAMEETSVATQAVGASIKGVMASLGAIGIAWAATAVALKAIQKVVEVIKFDAFKEANNDLQETISKVESLKDEIDKINDRIASGTGTQEDEQRLKILEKQLEVQEKLQQIKAQKAYDEYSGTEETDWKKIERIGDTIQDVAQQSIRSIQDLQKENEKLATQIEGIDTSTEKGRKEVEKLTESYDKNASSISELTEYVDEYVLQVMEQKEQGAALDEVGRQLIEDYENLSPPVLDYADSLNEANAETEKIVSTSDTLSSTLSNLKNETDLLTTAQKEMADNGELSIDTIIKMTEAGTDYMDLLFEENGAIKMNMSSAEAMFEAKKQIAIKNLENKKTELQEELKAEKAKVEATSAGLKATGETSQVEGKNTTSMMQIVTNAAQSFLANLGSVATGAGAAVMDGLKSATSALGAFQTSSGAVDSASSAIDDLEKQIKQVDAAIDYVSKQTLSSFSKASGKAAKATKGKTAATKKATDATKKNTAAIDANKKAQERLAKQIEKTKDAIQAENDAFAEKQKGYELFVKEVIKILDKEIEDLEKKKDLIEETYDEEIKAIEDKIDALDKEADKKKDLEKIEEARLNVLQKMRDLENAKKTVQRTFKAGEGWGYTQDITAVQNAKDELAEAQKSYQDLLDDWNLTQQKLELQAQVDALEEAKKQNIANIDEQIEKLKDFREEWSNAMDIAEDLTKYKGLVENLKKFENASYEERKKMLISFTNAWQSESKRHNAVIDSMNKKLKELENEAKKAKEEADRLTAAANKSKAAADNSAKSANNAKNAYNGANKALNNYKKNLETPPKKTKYVTATTLITEGNVVYEVITYSNGSIKKTKVGVKASVSGGGNEASGGGGGGVRYAKGGVVPSSAMLSYTGYMSNDIWVDGSQAKPEVIINNDSAEWLHKMLTSKIVPPEVQLGAFSHGGSNGDVFSIGNVNIQADSNDTVQGLTQELIQLAKQKR